MVFVGEVIFLLLPILSSQTKENKVPSLSLLIHQDTTWLSPSSGTCGEWEAGEKAEHCPGLPLPVLTRGRSSGLSGAEAVEGAMFPPTGQWEAHPTKHRILTSKNYLAKGAL